MKYWHVFLTWFWADVILGIGLSTYFILLSHFDIENLLSAFPAFVVFGFFGIMYSLPSLLFMLIFHFFYENYLKKHMHYVIPYILLILFINTCYVMVGKFAPDKYQPVYISLAYMRYWYYIFTPTTLAGFLSFYLVNRKIKK